MIKRSFVLLTLSLVFVIMAGCGDTGPTSPAQQSSNNAGASLHSQHAVQADSADLETSPAPVKQTAYSLDATAYEENGKFYIKAVTDLKLSSEHYGGEPVDGEGHIHVYVNGKLAGPIKDDTPFQLSTLLAGTYAIKLVLAENNHKESFGVSKELSVEKTE